MGRRCYFEPEKYFPSGLPSRQVFTLPRRGGLRGPTERAGTPKLLDDGDSSPFVVVKGISCRASWVFISVEAAVLRPRWLLAAAFFSEVPRGDRRRGYGRTSME